MTAAKWLWLNDFGQMASGAGTFTPSLDESPGFLAQEREEPVSTSSQNALWCRDFAAGKVILSIDIKGLAECRDLWRAV
jgi:hypothetical protein